MPKAQARAPVHTTVPASNSRPSTVGASMPVYVLQNVSKIIDDGGSQRNILDCVDLKIHAGEFCGIIGASGSGKSTLLNILGGIDTISKGQFSFAGKQLTLHTRREMALFRRNIGFVFQSFHLIEHLNVYHNVAMPLIIAREPQPMIVQRVEQALRSVNFIPDSPQEHAAAQGQRRLQQLPKTLSGGEKQRVALARALVHNPQVILADEPTGSLDSYNEQIILRLFKSIHQQCPGITIVLVTHSEQVIQHCARVIEIADGKIVNDTSHQRVVPDQERDYSLASSHTEPADEPQIPNDVNEANSPKELY